MTSRLFHDVEVDGRRVDVRVEHGIVTHVVAVGTAVPGVDDVVAGRGAGLLPGLHDHHLHLVDAAAVQSSVACDRDDISGHESLNRALRNAPGTGWMRVTSYRESIAGSLTRRDLDAMVPDRPVWLEHSGAELSVLNSRAVALAGDLLRPSRDVERNHTGVPTGRLWRYAERLQGLATPSVADLARFGRQLRAYGITGVTDATPDLCEQTVALLSEAARRGAVPRSMLLGVPDGHELPETLTEGPWTLPVRSDAPPSLDELTLVIREVHTSGRAVAVRCDSHHTLRLVLDALDLAGRRPGDRIEHAVEIHPEDYSRLRGTAVVLQPGSARPGPYASLLASGIAVAPSSDAPHGVLNPWQIMSVAARRGIDGRAQGDLAELVPARAVLAGYLSDPHNPGGPARRVEVGARADLVLLDGPLATVLARVTARVADHNPVAATYTADREPLAGLRASTLASSLRVATA